MATSNSGARAHRAGVERRLESTALVALFTLSAACGSTNDTIALPRDPPQTVPDPNVNCPGPMAATEGVIALYTFDQDEGSAQLADSAGNHSAALQLGVVTTVDGPDDCDRAFSFDAGGDPYIVIDDSPDWDLEVGSIDLWFWLPAQLTDHVGVFSRDVRERDEPGHISLFVDIEGHAQVRVQPEDDSSENLNDAVSCSVAPLPRERWVHLGVNFGSPAVELYVDGLLARGEGAHALSDEWFCGQSGGFGIAGNDLPWVVGRSTYRSSGALETPELPASGCAIDHLRISSERRDFASVL
jgi:hypothetical protein